MGFSGRCEAIKAPTTENDTVQMAKMTIPSSEIKKISPRVCSLRRARIKFAAASATHSAHSDQASHAATRALILPSPRPCCSLAPSVTTPLYSTTISKALLRTALRGRTVANFVEPRKGEEVRRIPLLKPSEKPYERAKRLTIKRVIAT